MVKSKQGTLPTMFTRIWLWLRGSYVHSAITNFEKAKDDLLAAVNKEQAILNKYVEKRQKAVELSTDIQAAIKADYERQVKAEAERHTSELEKADTKVADTSASVNRGHDLLDKLKGI